VVLQTAIPALLFVPGAQSARKWIRAASYFTGFLGFSAPKPIPVDPARRHPAFIPVMLITLYLTVLLVATPGRLLPAAAEFVLVVSVMAPVLWAPGLMRDPAQLHRILWLLMLSSGLNSLVGVLQVYDPDRWMPQVLSQQITDLSLYRYAGADGRSIIRPCGLYDTPGAVSAPGAWAALTGFALFQQERRFFRRAISLGCAFLGVAVIYLTLVRTAFVIVLVGAVCYAAILAFRRQEGDATSFAVGAGATMVAALLFASVFGGSKVTSRFASLFQSDPTKIYYQSRGVQLEYAMLNDTNEYPLGAGLGTWGMVPAYFGGGSKFAEVQAHGWILDGGLPLLVLYSAAILAAIFRDLKYCMTTRSKAVFQWATCITAVNISTAITVLSFVPFNTQIGMQFWLLTGVLHGAALVEQRQRQCPVPG